MKKYKSIFKENKLLKKEHLKFLKEKGLLNTRSKVNPINRVLLREKGRKIPMHIHVPKTGGRYIREMFRKSKIKVAEPGHLSALTCLSFLGKSYKSRYTFACVRNPYERFLSACVFNRHKDFESISETLVKDGVLAVKPPVHFVTQKSLLTDEKGKLIVNRVGRFEDFNGFIEDLKKDGIDITEIHEFKESKSSNWPEILTEKTIKNIRTFYKEDFKFFKYKM